MKMKRCRYCGWWFEPKTPRQSYCDEECSQEGRKASWRKSYHRRKEEAKKPEAKKPEEKKPSILKVDISRLPTPMFPPTTEVRGTSLEDRKLQKIMEAMERQRKYSDA